MTAQADMVLDYIERFGSITPLDAFRDLGVTRLSAVVFDLRRKGHDIETAMESAQNRFGKKTSYARYRMADRKIEKETGQWLLWQS